MGMTQAQALGVITLTEQGPPPNERHGSLGDHAARTAPS